MYEAIEREREEKILFCLSMKKYEKLKISETKLLTKMLLNLDLKHQKGNKDKKKRKASKFPWNQNKLKQMN